MKVRLLEERKNGDTYFVGDLAAGLSLAAEDRWIVHRMDGETHEVLLCDADPEQTDDPWGEAAEWGRGRTREEAERYALGAAFGPIDAEYDEENLAVLLSLHRAFVRDGRR